MHIFLLFQGLKILYSLYQTYLININKIIIFRIKMMQQLERNNKIT